VIVTGNTVGGVEVFRVMGLDPVQKSPDEHRERLENLTKKDLKKATENNNEHDS